MDSRIGISVQTRLFLLIVVFTWMMTTAFFVMQYSRERAFKVELLDTRLQQVNNALLERVANDEPINERIIASVDPNDSLRVSIINFDGKMIYDSGLGAGQASAVANHSDRQEFVDAMSKGHGITVRRLSTRDDREYFYSATRGDSVVVRSSLPYNHSLSQMLSADQGSSYLIVGIAVLMTIVAWLASHNISKSVKRLRDFAVKAEFGDISEVDMSNFPDDELGEISSHIVNLYRIQKETAEQRDKHMREAMHEQREKNRIKHQLTNNLNHELKTPVHVIQASLETLHCHSDELSEPVKAELINKSYDSAKRLCALLDDLSMITRMTDAPEQIARTQVDVVPIVQQVTADMAALAAEKQMRIHINLGEQLTVCGNERLLDSIFRNLMVNSLNYSNGRDVWVTLSNQDQEEVEITFEDNGVGVMAEHLPHLFERFYRIDKGRSRSLGGTGLGLSIVKNAVLFHGGEISVENRETTGLRFVFTLEKTGEIEGGHHM